VGDEESDSDSDSESDSDRRAGSSGVIDLTADVQTTAGPSFSGAVSAGGVGDDMDLDVEPIIQPSAAPRVAESKEADGPAGPTAGDVGNAGQPIDVDAEPKTSGSKPKPKPEPEYRHEEPCDECAKRGIECWSPKLGEACLYCRNLKKGCVKATRNRRRLGQASGSTPKRTGVVPKPAVKAPPISTGSTKGPKWVGGTPPVANLRTSASGSIADDLDAVLKSAPLYRMDPTRLETHLPALESLQTEFLYLERRCRAAAAIVANVIGGIRGQGDADGPFVTESWREAHFAGSRKRKAAEAGPSTSKRVRRAVTPIEVGPDSDDDRPLSRTVKLKPKPKPEADIKGKGKAVEEDDEEEIEEFSG
jgi:hypothetical protein